MKTPRNDSGSVFSNWFHPARRALWAALIVVLAVAAVASAEKPAPTKVTLADPYVFVLFDTSGSMHWTPPCTQADFDAGLCEYLCPSPVSI